MKRSSSQLAALAAFVAVGFFAFVALRSTKTPGGPTTVHQAATTLPPIADIPIPFFDGGSNEAGSIRPLGTIRLTSGSTATVSLVELKNDTNANKSQQLSADNVYLISTPPDATRMPMDVAFTRVNNKMPNYFCYHYSPGAAEEIAHKNDAAKKDQFPRTFLWSQTARDEDVLNAMGLHNFATNHQITWHLTDGTDQTGYFEPDALYVCVANIGTATTTVMLNPTAICGDRWMMGTEGCDDGNTTAGDGCSATCTIEGGYNCTGNPSVCTQDTGPTITAVNAAPAETSAVVTWTTSPAADSQVEYGTTTAYGSSTTLDATQVTAHSVNLSTLTAGTTYHYRVKSKVGTNGTVATSADATFTTTQQPQLAISNVQATNLTANSATITWTTNIAATSQVQYGTTTAYGSSTTPDATMVTSHTVTIPGLTASTLYHFKALSTLGGSSTPVESNDGTFTTTAAATVCGNGIVETGEECDEGAQNGQGVCTTQCRLLIPF